MKKKLAFLGIVVFLVLVILGWYLLSPLFIDTRVNESFPETAMETPEVLSMESIIPKKTEGTDVLKDAKTSGESTENEVILPQPILSGMFEDVDFVHKGKGTARVFRLSDGMLVLRLEDFEVTNGPGLHVILSKHPRPRSSGEVKDIGYLDLGNLKGSIGNQNYTLPDGIDISEFKSVVIYCYPFNVVFSTATLE